MRAVVLWSLLSWAAPALGAELTGTLADPAGQPLPGVTVSLLRGSRVLRVASTDATGGFRFETEAGEYALAASVAGFKPLRRAVAVTGGPSDPLVLALEPAPLQETVVVIGRRAGGAEGAAVPTSVDVVGADQLEDENVDETLEVLRRVPGVYTADYNQGIISGDLGIRGFNTEGEVAHTKLLIDGIPNNLNNGFNDMKSLFPLEIESIELVKGTNDARYGLHNIAGNLNVHTRRGGAERTLKALLGDFGTKEAQAIGSFQTGPIAHTYFAAARASDGYREHSGQDKHALSGKWFYGAGGERPLSVGLIARRFEFDGDAPGYLTRSEARANPERSPAFSSTDGGAQSNRHLSLHLDHQLAAHVSWSLKVYGQTLDKRRWVRFTAAGTQQERVEDETQYGAVGTLAWAPPEGPVGDLHVRAGLDFQHQDDLHQRYRSADRTRGALLRDHDFDFHNAGGFLTADGRPAGWLRLNAGLRVDRVGGRFHDRLANRELNVLPYGTIWQPKVGAVLLPGRALNVYGNWGRAFQVGVGAGAFGTQDLGYSKNDGWEAGLKWSAARRLAVRGAYWVQAASDEVRLKFDNSGDSENVGRTRRSGWDLSLTAEPHRTLYLWGALTTQKAKLVEPGARDPLLRGKELHHVPGYTAKGGVDFTPTPRITASLSWQSQDDYQLTNLNDLGEFGGYSLLNLDLFFKHGRARLGLHVKNALDRYFEGTVWFDGSTTLHSPGDPRAAYLTLQLGL